MADIKVKAMAIVARDDGSILATLGTDTVSGEKFARIPGGHVELSETAESTVKREMLEEFGSELEDIEFVKVMENIFTYLGEPGHEIVFVYRANLKNRDLYEKETLNILDKPSVQAVWVSRAHIESGEIPLYPKGLPELL